MKKLLLSSLLFSALLLTSCFNSQNQASEEPSLDENGVPTTDVIPEGAAKYTILAYVCGSTLEYGPENSWSTSKTIIGAASEDILEMMAANGQTDDVNVVIETGGSGKWASNPGITAKKICRYHVKDQQLYKDYTSESNSNMGLSKTLEDFVTWGMKTYPAEKYGLILWNHGGAVGGVCFDDNYSMDGLTTSEVGNAIKNSLIANQRSRLEWIGYDACVMNFLDNASVNADYCRYMIAAQELENGDGWDYSWLNTLFANPSISTPSLLEDIANKFVTQYGTGTDNDQTLSVLDLSKMANFTTKFEAYSKNFKSTDFSKIKSIYNSGLTFGEDAYGIMDFKDFLNKAASNFSYSTEDVEAAFDGLVIANKYGNKYKNSSIKPCGTNIFIATGSDIQVAKSEYTTADTKLQSWRSLNIANGKFYSSSGYGY